MPAPCAHLQTCEFLLDYSGITSSAKEDFIHSYCADETTSALCLRRLYIEQVEKKPPVSLDPEGSLRPRISMV